MGDAFPELKKNPDRVMKLIEDEEISFGRTLDRGIGLFEEERRQAIWLASPARVTPYGGPAIDGEEVKKQDVSDWDNRRPDRVWAHKPCISAEAAFKLHDTYGFPIDLTRIMAEERGLKVDIAGYEKLMEQAKEIARAGGREAESKVTQLTPGALAKLERAGIKPTDDSAKYSHDEISATVLAIWDGQSLGLSPASALEDEEVAVILDKTNFYAEMGGQVGDAGELRCASGAVFDVATTRIVGGYLLHVGKVRSGTLHVRDAVAAKVLGGRTFTEKNHTATHLLNWALRQAIDGDVLQKGSLVDAEKLRFDFTHGKGVNDDELARTQTLVAQAIAEMIPVYTDTAPQEKALKINGLRAVFGEKYPPNVRVISVGVALRDVLADPGNSRWRDYSIEFCGGTHLTNTSQIEAFTITSEESISKGVRRITGLTGPAAREAEKLGGEIDRLAAQAPSCDDAGIPPLIAALQKAIGASNVPLLAKRRGQAAVAQLQIRLKTLEKAQKAQSASAASVDVAATAEKLLDGASSYGPGKLIVGEIAGAGGDQLRVVVDSLKKRTPSYAILVGAFDGAKVNFTAAVSDDLVGLGLKAGDWVKQAAQITGGGGGGRPQTAQGSGKDPARLADALAAARQFAAKVVP